MDCEKACAILEISQKHTADCIKKAYFRMALRYHPDKYKEDNESLVAAVYNGSCGSCFNSLPAQSLQDTKNGKLITCPSCSIYLYFDEDSQ